MKLCAIADEFTVRGFRLAGVDGFVVATAAQAEAAVHKAMSMPDCLIIILTEKTAQEIRNRIEELRQQRNRPLIVEIPGPEGQLPGHKGLRQVVQEAVGVRVD